MTKRNRAASTLRRAVAIPVMALMLAGCAGGNDAPESAGSDPIENAEPHTAAVAAAVESLQQQIWGGAWTPAVGGNLLVPCGPEGQSGSASDAGEGDYRFYGSWLTADGYEAPADLQATAEEFSSWLKETGWSDVEVESSDSPHYWRVWATQEGTELAETMVTWYPAGDVDVTEPHVVLDLDSECVLADAKA